MAAQRALQTGDSLLITARRVAVYPVFALEIEIVGSQLEKQKVEARRVVRNWWL